MPQRHRFHGSCDGFQFSGNDILLLQPSASLKHPPDALAAGVELERHLWKMTIQWTWDHAHDSLSVESIVHQQQGVLHPPCALMAGGLVLRSERVVVGAIDLSGMTPDQDIAIARAGTECFELCPSRPSLPQREVCKWLWSKGQEFQASLTV